MINSAKVKAAYTLIRQDLFAKDLPLPLKKIMQLHVIFFPKKYPLTLKYLQKIGNY